MRKLTTILLTVLICGLLSAQNIKEFQYNNLESISTDITLVDLYSVDNVDEVYNILKTKRNTLDTKLIKDFAYFNKTQDTLFLQANSEMSYYIIEIWKTGKTDKTIKGDIPYVVLYSDVAQLIKKRK